MRRVGLQAGPGGCSKRSKRLALVAVGIALVGFVGVIAGALVSGGVQAALAYNARRLESRTAARMLYMNLFEAHSQMHRILAASDWRVSSASDLEFGGSWQRFESSWEIHQEALARVLDADSFFSVTLALTSIKRTGVRQANRIQDFRERGATSAPLNDVDKDSVRGSMTSIDTAEGVVWRSTRPRWRRKDFRRSPLRRAIEVTSIAAPDESD